MDPQGAIIFPYVYGSMAFSLGKKSQSYTHKWICYVRGINNENLSYLISKVQFQLHSSFQNPIKIIEKPPFEIQEFGWGEFEILIRIYFQHPDMPCIQVPHMLKLHGNTSSSQANKKPICSEVYDEIVFLKSDESIVKMQENKLNAQANGMLPEMEMGSQETEVVTVEQPLKSIYHYSKYFSEIKPEDHYSKLDEALKFINYEIRILDEKMRNSDSDITKVYEEIYPKLS